MRLSRTHAPEADTFVPSIDLPPMPGDIGRMDGAVRDSHRNTEPAFGKFMRWTSASTLGAVAAGAVWLGADIVHGVHDGREAVQSSHAMVHEVYGSHTEIDVLHAHHGTFVLTGLGTKNPTKTAEVLEVHKEAGQVFALEYSNRDLDTKDMAKRVIATAKTHELTEISFDGYSAGGPIALDIAAHIREMEPELNIVAIVFNSSPIGDDSLTDRSREGIDLMQTILSVDEDLAYYLKGRIATELLARSDRYIERSPASDRRLTIHSYKSFDYNGTHYEVLYPNILPELYDIIDKLSDEDAASAMLIWEQAKFIVQTDYEKNIATLPEDTLIVYTCAWQESDDQVVATNPSATNLQVAAEKHNLQFKLIKAQVGHANPGEDTAQYTNMIRQIQPYITNRLVKIVLPREMATHALPSSTEPNAQVRAEAAPPR
ncbi:hypothetical protein GII36_02905 [Candidatus Mycosynbacter amalyticus]|uniref:Alpha/beta hydrolase n=1 Tax=Candidatus Mycosynbacter amalyticus TaxID=2665156 RepID=A0A857MQ69_9BACT|nr:hypothetical protein [Candidatus Mycosynbacter amalyticus]QHN42790.1 hypothetical protein GII36_02905 [Candidatus Mycosynbacter amalyticus]